MSEYQYYEFQCVDRPLNAKENKQSVKYQVELKLHRLKQFLIYSYGDFSQNSEKFLAQCFDVMY